MFSSYSNAHEKPKTIHILTGGSKGAIQATARHRALNYHYKAMCVCTVSFDGGCRVENVVGVGRLYLCRNRLLVIYVYQPYPKRENKK
jgi:hypothetical protein